MGANKAAFLDRDGTIVVGLDQIRSADELRFINGSGEALKLFGAAGYLLVIVSNQGGVALGAFSRRDLQEMDVRLREMVSGLGLELAGTYYCTDRPDSACSCRKPEPGLALAAAEELDIDISSSWVIGDKTSDVMLGRNIGCRSALVLTGKAGNDGRFEVEADLTGADLLECARIITTTECAQLR
jgi:D-glycero-D-manno-heptose 1,7-bisphosphate phosphatase